MSGDSLQAAQIRLRQSQAGDIPLLFRWYSDPVLRTLYDGIPFPTANLAQFEAAYLRWLDTEAQAGVAGSFIMELISDGRAIGECSWAQVQRTGPNSPGIYQVGGIIGDEHLRGHGLGTEALQLLRDYLFREQGAHRLEAMTNAFNGGAMKTLHRNGFVREGVLREAVMINGVWQDRVLFSLLKSEWEEGALPKREFPHD